MTSFKQFILFNYKTGLREKVTIEQVTGYTGMSKSQLWMLKYKNRRITCIDSYLLDLDTPLEVYKGIMAKHGDLEGEAWVDYKGYYVSSKGRVKSPKGKFILPTYNSGVLKVALSRHDKSYALHRLVYELFVGTLTSNDAVVHINNNNADCEALNLKKVKRGAQSNHYGQKTKPVVRIDEHGEVEYFDSMGECAVKSYVGVGTVRAGILDHKMHCGYYFILEKDYKEDL